MPVHLPQLSRRDFLKRAAMAGAGLALAPHTFGALADKSRDEHTFALLSDTHIAADAGQISRNVNMADNLTAVARELAALPRQPAATLINGDLAFKAGLPGDYATLGNLLTPIRAVSPVFSTLGNHDQRDNFWSAFPIEAAAQRLVKEKQTSILRSARANWLLLDSLEITDATPGELGGAQLAWLDRELAAAKDKPAIIFGHHNPNLFGTVNGLKDTDALAELFVRHRHVKAFVFGHTHFWAVAPHYTGVHLINLPPTSYIFKEGRPSGWVRATLTTDGIELELRCLDAKHPAHGKVQQLQWHTTT